MVKSRAEIQKAYRERLKERDNDGYLAKERRRRMSNYVPSGQLSRSERAHRNNKNKEYLRQHRRERKLHVVAEHACDTQDGFINTSGYESASSISQQRDGEGPSRLIVQMNFSGRGNGSRVRTQNALRKYKQDLKTLKGKYDKVQRKLCSTKRSVQRHSNKAKPVLTPRKKVEKQIKSICLSTR